MSLQDIDSISTMMLGELRDVHNLEKEMLETKEAVSIQEHRFEQEVENLCTLDKRKADLERRFMDLAERADIECCRATELFNEHRRATTSVSMFQRIESLIQNRDNSAHDISKMMEACSILENQSSVLRGNVREDILVKVNESESALANKKQSLQQHQDNLLKILEEEEKANTATNHFKLRQEKMLVDTNSLQDDIKQNCDALNIDLALQADAILTFEKLQADLNAECTVAEDKLFNASTTLKCLSEQVALMTEAISELLTKNDAAVAENRKLSELSIERAQESRRLQTEFELVLVSITEKNAALSFLMKDICLLESQAEALNLRADNFSLTDSSTSDLFNLECQLQELNINNKLLSDTLSGILDELSAEKNGKLNVLCSALESLRTKVNESTIYIARVRDGTNIIRSHVENTLIPLINDSNATVRSLDNDNCIAEQDSNELQTNLHTAYQMVEDLQREQTVWQGLRKHKLGLLVDIDGANSLLNEKTIELDRLKREEMEVEIQREVCRQKESDMWISSQIKSRLHGYEKQVLAAHREKVRSLKTELSHADTAFTVEFKRLEKDYNTRKRFLINRIGEISGRKP